jgi:hypothetical protein
METLPTGVVVKFPLGDIVMTPKVMAALDENKQGMFEFIHRHAACDWGVVDESSWLANDEALTTGAVVLSAYTMKNGTIMHIMTVEDRSTTIALLPEEFDNA